MRRNADPDDVAVSGIIELRPDAQGIQHRTVPVFLVIFLFHKRIEISSLQLHCHMRITKPPVHGNLEWMILAKLFPETQQQFFYGQTDPQLVLSFHTT